MYPNFRLFWRTTYRSFFKSKHTPARLTRKRIIFLLLFYTVWPIGQLIHWFCFFLDDILFPGHKTQPVEKPLFILGNLRSGSTFLHRLLSRDSETFTSLTIWDIYLTPSVTQKKITQFFSRLDNKLGGHLHRLLYAFDRRTLGSSKSIPFHFSSRKRMRTFSFTSGIRIGSVSSSPSWMNCQIISISMRRYHLNTSVESWHFIDP